MPGVRSIAMKSIRTTILPLHKIFIIHLRKNKINQNDVEFDLRGSALFEFFFYYSSERKTS